MSATSATADVAAVRQTEDGFALTGPVTISTALNIIDAARVSWPETGDSVVDFAGVTEADSAALALIFKWQRDAARRERKIRCINIPANVAALARLYGVDELIPA
ncbi:MAG: STAS domain-containing protein [Betaproteobacteria bacterium]